MFLHLSLIMWLRLNPFAFVFRTQKKKKKKKKEGRELRRERERERGGGGEERCCVCGRERGGRERRNGRETKR